LKNAYDKQKNVPTIIVVLLVILALYVAARFLVFVFFASDRLSVVASAGAVKVKVWLVWQVITEQLVVHRAPWLSGIVREFITIVIDLRLVVVIVLGVLVRPLVAGTVIHRVGVDVFGVIAMMRVFFLTRKWY
jgi:hypothetical protein